MNRRSTRLFTILTFLAILLSFILNAATPAYAAATDLDMYAMSIDEGSGFVIRDNNVNGIWGKVSVPNDVTIPNLDTDSCTSGPPTCSTEEVATFGPMFHFRGNCFFVGVAWKKYENNTPTQRLEVQDACASNTAGDPVVVYSQDITNATWRSTYASSISLQPPHYNDGWTGQTSTYTDTVIEISVDNVAGARCIHGQIFNHSTLTWNGFYTNCGETRTYSGGTKDRTYVAMTAWWGGLDKFRTSGDLGSAGLLEVRDVQFLNQSGSGTWAIPSRKLSVEDGQWNRWDASPPGTRIQPLISDSWYVQWGADLGYSGDLGNIWLCDKVNGNGVCNYTNEHVDYDAYNTYSASPGSFGNAFSEAKPQDQLVIQRASPDNSILRGYNPKLKSDRSYYIRQMNGGSGGTLWVDVAGLGAGNYTITGQGYVKTDTAGTNPTCTWVTSTKYQCVPGTSGLSQVYVKIKTLVTTATITGLSVQTNNDEFGTRTRTVYIAP